MNKKTLKTISIVILVISIILIAGISIYYYILQNESTETPIVDRTEEANSGCFCTYSKSNTCSSITPDYSFSLNTDQDCETACNNNKPDLQSCTTIKKVDDKCPEGSSPNSAGLCIKCSPTELQFCQSEDLKYPATCKQIGLQNTNGISLIEGSDSSEIYVSIELYKSINNESIDYSDIILTYNGEDITISGNCTADCEEGEETIKIKKKIDISKTNGTINLSIIPKSNYNGRTDDSACSAIYKLNSGTKPYCSGYIVNTTDVTKQPVEIIQSEIVISNPLEKTELQSMIVEFSFTGLSNQDKNRTKDLLSIYGTDGKIKLNRDYLYSIDNFENKTLFPDFNFTTTSIAKTADFTISPTIEYTLKGSTEAVKMICPSQTIRIVRADYTEPKEEEQAPEDTAVKEPEKPVIEDKPTAEVPKEDTSNTTDKPIGPTFSDFSLSEENIPQCVERVTPNNRNTYSFNINNESGYDQRVNSFIIKLPYGFQIDESTVNFSGTLDGIDIDISTDPTDNSQITTVTPRTTFDFSPNSKAKLSFDASATETALSENNQLEIALVPLLSPRDVNTTTLKSTVPVRQYCTIPQTNSNSTLITTYILSILIMIVAVIYLENGSKLDLQLFTVSNELNSRKRETESKFAQLIKAIKLWYLKHTNRKKYLEEQLSKELDK